MIPRDFVTRLREDMRNRRSGLAESERSRFDDAIRRHLSRLVRDLDPGKIAAYWPFKGEPDLTPLFGPLADSGRELALPVISDGDNHAMTFHAWRPGTRLTANRYGILEPAGAPQIELADYDLLLMPLVAYDMSGNRLGMGMGYYDRHLASLRDAPRPLRAGIAYGLQQSASLEGNPWDIPLHGVVNERGWFTFVPET